MHDPDFLVFKEAQTDIEFIVRNVDRKPINIEGRTLCATLVNYKSGQTMAVIPLSVVDAKRGIARLSFMPHMVKDIPLGTHRYVISYILDNGNAKLLNQDRYEKIYGFFDLKYGRELQGVQSQSYCFDDFLTVNENRFDTYWVSPSFRGNLTNGSLNGVHTMAWYMEDWTGSVWIEGSLSPTSPDENDWFPIMIDQTLEHKLENQTGIVANNIDMNLHWVRFKFKPELYNNGKFTKVMFRN